jgi:exopolysaccharide biosynthesis polyprenyl glycosylphosphotransferase
MAVYIFWGVVLTLFIHSESLYYTNRYLSITGEWLKVGRCVLYTSVMTVFFIFALKIDIFPRSVFIETTVSLLFTLSAWRTFKRIWVRYLIKNGYSNQNAVVVGAGAAGVSLAEEIASFPYLGIKICGFLDDKKTEGCQNIKVLGKICDLEKVVNKYFIDEIYVTIPSERSVVAEVIQKGTKLGRTVRVMAEYFNLPYRNVRLSHLGSIPLMTYFEKAPRASESIVKRAIDVVLSGLILLLAMPLLFLVAFLIKAESPGPVFFVSRRSGKKGVPFEIYKFRSMVDNADVMKEKLRHKSDVEGPIFKIRKDPRFTRIGRFLRKYSIDELPQLVNVLKGDMSLVGPRPFPVEESDKVENRHIPRLNIKPGITGLAQVKGRSDLKFSNWMRWDIWYVENWSIWLDIKILFWTIPVVLAGKGAY